MILGHECRGDVKAIQPLRVVVIGVGVLVFGLAIDEGCNIN